MPYVLTFDPVLHKVSAFSIPVQGFADGDAIRTELDEQDFTTKVGLHGDVVVTRNHNPLGMVTLLLQNESPSNDRLSARRTLGRASPAFFGPFRLQNLNGTTLIAASRCWIEKPPNYGVGKESGSVEWTLRAAFDVYHIGGAVL